MKTTLIFAVSATLAIAADAPEPAAESIAKTYQKSLERLTKKPKSFAIEFTTLCGPSPLEKRVGPHAQHFVHYYRNNLAKSPAGNLPVGSVIVKEKLSAAPGTKEPREITGVAGMIKRPAGTFPKSGDWEFFWAAEGKLTAINAQNCAGCHTGAKRDYVFSDLPRK